MSLKHTPCTSGSQQHMHPRTPLVQGVFPARAGLTRQSALSAIFSEGALRNVSASYANTPDFQEKAMAAASALLARAHSRSLRA